MAELKIVHVRDARQWRAWLQEQHARNPGVWLMFYKNHTGRKSISYEEAVRGALCYGWIDSLIKRLDENRYLRKFTPRKSTSKWSDINRKRWMELKKRGLLASSGLSRAPTANQYGPRPSVPDLPAYIAKALKAHPRAWQYFRQLTPMQRRHFVVWIHTAKRPETRLNRIRESIALLAAQKKLGLK